MRNYCDLFVIQLDFYDSTPVLVLTEYAIGAREVDATNAATAREQQLPTFTSVRTNLGKKYWLISRGFMASYLCQSGGGITCSQFSYDRFQQGIVLDGSPKRNPSWGYKSDVKPGVTFSGAKRAGKQTLTLETYLIYLLASWTAGVRLLQNDRVTVVKAPKRWLDWLTRLILDLENKRVSSMQVYAFLAQVDFTGVPPKIP